MRDDWPDPQAATDPAGFVASMRELRARTGLSFRALERNAAKAGDILPTSTSSAALSRDKLPRPELVAAFVRACGGDEQTVQTWVAARARLAAGPVEPPPAAVAEPPAERVEPEEPGHKKRRWQWAGAAAVLVVAAVTLIAFTIDRHSAPAGQSAAAPPPPVSSGPALQPIRLAYTGLCVGEGPEKFKDSGRIVLGQHNCAVAGPPIELEPVGEGVYRLILHNPDLGPGCVTVDYGGTAAEVLLAGAECEGDRPDQRFTFEPVSTPLAGYRIHSVAGARWCIGVFEGRTEPGVQLIQNPCDGGAQQVFLVDGL